MRRARSLVAALCLSAFAVAGQGAVLPAVGQRDATAAEYALAVAQRDTASAAWAVAMRDCEYWKSKAMFQADLDSIHQVEARANMEWALNNQMKIIRTAALSSLATAIVTVAIFYAVR